MAQLVRAPPCHGGGREFESHLGRSYETHMCANGILAQLGEHLPYKQRVIGSSPIGPILFYLDGFPSGQRGQTVNLLQIASVVRIHLHPFEVCVADFNLCINEVNGTSLVRMSMI